MHLERSKSQYPCYYLQSPPIHICCRWDNNTYPKKLKILWIHTSKIWIKLACQDGHQKEEDSCLALIRRTTPDIYARTMQFIWRQSVQNWRRSSQFMVILGINQYKHILSEEISLQGDVIVIGKASSIWLQCINYQAKLMILDRITHYTRMSYWQVMGIWTYNHESGWHFNLDLPHSSEKYIKIWLMLE